MLIYLLSLPLGKERPEVGGSWQFIFILLCQCQRKSSLASQTDKIHSHSPKSPSLRSFPLRRCSGCFPRPERSRLCGVGSQHFRQCSILPLTYSASSVTKEERLGSGNQSYFSLKCILVWQMLNYEVDAS